MFRIRWFDAELDDPATPVEWPIAALILATLFLNFFFWEAYGVPLRLFFPLPLYTLFLSGVALLVTAVFFMGPTLAAHAVQRPLFEVVENSIGSIPAFALRGCCALFLILWIAALTSIVVSWSSYMFRKPISTIESCSFAAAILVFVFATGLQSLQTEARLARFTSKLGFAILIAALIRVHDGWPAALGGFELSDGGWPDVWRGLSDLAFYVAPLAFLAADFGHRSRGRRKVALIGLMGFAVPLFGALLLVGLINAATLASPFYQPSLNPSVAMALWSRAAGSALPGRMMIAAITIFGAARFGVRALAKTASIRTPMTRRGLIWLGCLVPAIAWSSLHSYDPTFTAAFDLLSRCLGVTSAVVTADLLMGRQRFNRMRIDWVGFVALLAGLATPWYVTHGPVELRPDPWWHAWLLPSYLTALLACLCGRAAQKLVSTGASGSGVDGGHIH